MIAKGFLISETALLDGNGAVSKEADLLVRKLEEKEIPFVILSDQSSLSRQEIAEYYRKQGISMMKTSRIYTSTMAAIDWIFQYEPQKKCAAYIGGKGMVDLLRSTGFSVDLDRADWLFIGNDRNATYQDYSYGLKIALGGATIIETDSRKLYTNKHQEPQIGSGAIAQMLSDVSGAKIIQASMPGTLILQRSAGYLGMLFEDLVFVGCDLQKEIASANQAGLKTAIVTEAMGGQINLLSSNIHPTYVVDNLLGLLSK